MENVLNKFGFINLLWVSLYLICGLLIPVLSAGSHSNPEVSSVLWKYAVVGLVYGAFLISLSSMFYLKKWVKRFCYINGFMTLITGNIIPYYILKMITL